MFYEFNVDLSQPFNVIHPIQLNAVKGLLNKDIPDQVKRIYLFGSSLELTCDKNSDIDIYVLSDEDHDITYNQIHALCKGLGKPFDILVSSVDEFINNANEINTVENDVVKGGVCIYAKI